MSDFSELTLLTILILSLSFIIVLIKIILRSKCYQFECLWGFLKVMRDVNIEKDIENNKINHNIIDDDKIDINNIINNLKNNNIN